MKRIPVEDAQESFAGTEALDDENFLILIFLFQRNLKRVYRNIAGK